jgi:hypothetical protein
MGEKEYTKTRDSSLDNGKGSSYAVCSNKGGRMK